MEHLVQYILLQTDYQQQQHQHHNYNQSKSSQHHNDHSDSDEESQLESSDLMEERNNVAHVMHVLFATYRQFYHPWQLFTEIIRQKPFASTKQFNFILFYWLNNYPEDFWTPCQPSMANPNMNYNDDQAGSHNNHNGSPENGHQMLDDQSSLCSEYASSSSLSSNIASYTAPSLSLSSTSNNVSTDSSLSSTSISLSRFSPLTLADQLISIRHIDEEVKKHCLHLLDMRKENTNNSSTLNPHSTIHKSVNKSSSIIELDAKFVAQQLTAIDL
ncbi:hypothetical protein BLA29_008070, partial [Euroglyphus maynei]